MPKLLAIAALVLVSLGFTVGRASAQTAQFTLNDGVGTPNAGTYTPGSSFTLAVNLVFTPGGNISDLESLTYHFEQQIASAPYYFAITNRDVGNSQFTSFQTPNLTYPQSLMPANPSDLGAERGDFTGVGAGTYFIANLTFSIAPNAATGTYTIESGTAGGARSSIGDSQGDPSFPISQSFYAITVVPEPSMWALGLLGGVAGMIAVRRGTRRNA